MAPIHAIIILMNLIVFLGCVYFLIVILSIYVVFLLLPDGFNNIICAIDCLFMALGYSERERPKSFDEIQNLEMVFYYFSTFNLNCRLAYEMHAMVDKSTKYDKSYRSSWCCLCSGVFVCSMIV